jgi:hypothetical protein
MLRSTIGISIQGGSKSIFHDRWHSLRFSIFMGPYLFESSAALPRYYSGEAKIWRETNLQYAFCSGWIL